MFTFQTEESVASLKERLKNPEGELEVLRFELSRAAKKQQGLGPWSTTFAPPGAASGNGHDYFSLAPYWWPDPDAPDPKAAPYVRRDGVRNPERLKYRNSSDLSAMGEAVHTLCAAGYLLEERSWLDRAAQLVQVWFLDEETAMNPHLEFAQAIPNICDGRGIGIIELMPLDRVVHAMGYLEAAGGYSDAVLGLRAWLDRMLDWLITSEKGLAEEKNGNNHEVYYNAHIGLYALWLGRRDVLARMIQNYKTRIVPLQIEPDGAMVRELGRTRSFHYALYNLDALALVCEIAWQAGEDLWHFKAGDRCIQAAIDFLVPHIGNPFLWRFTQIDGEMPADRFALQAAAMRLGRPDLAALNRQNRAGMRLWRYRAISPLCLLDGYDFSE